ncbi:MAG: hypothetical protein P0107_05435 [Nitrosomonas sp.]|nr:hypothetical protein [Nitrosomonas sp.]
MLGLVIVMLSVTGIIIWIRKRAARLSIPAHHPVTRKIPDPQNI